MKHWVFDLDGTLVDSHSTYEQSVEAILTELGVEPTKDIVSRAYKFFNPQDYFNSVFEDSVKAEKALQRLMEFNEYWAPKTLAFQGIPNLLEDLLNKDVRLSVWTGRDLQTARKVLAGAGLLNYVGLCVGRTCVPQNKPAPDGLLKILKDTKDHGDNVVMVGDHEYDMRGARSAGVRGFSVGWGSPHQFASADLADLHFDKVEQMREWISINI